MQSFHPVYKYTDKELLDLFYECAGYWKIRSMLFLKLCKFPMLDFVIVSKWDNSSEKGIKDFFSHLGSESVLFRHDKSPEDINAPRGGFSISRNNVKNIIESYLDSGRVVILLKDAPKFNNGYNISVLLTNSGFVFEILGPGFDASDLQRGDLSPHEVFHFDNGFKLLNHFVTSNFDYKKSVELRLRKISDMLTNQGIVSKHSMSSEVKIIKALSVYTQSLLPKHLKKYKPIPINDILSICALLKPFPEELSVLWPEVEIPCVIAFSFINGSSLNAWDIVFPKLKYQLKGSNF